MVRTSAHRSVAVVSLAGVALLVWIGVQPPNEKALIVTFSTTLLLLVSWWLGVRKLFAGPPLMSIGQESSQVALDANAD